MPHTRKAVAALGVAVLITIMSAGAAQAASKSGTLNCPAYYPTGKLTTTTTGSTRHTWVDSDTGTVKVVDLAGGTGRTSTGFHNSSWVATATTVTSASGTCV